jgi:hypothetical protein
VDRHECIQRRSAAGIAKRATCTIIRNIVDEGTDNACRSNKTSSLTLRQFSVTTVTVEKQ